MTRKYILAGVASAAAMMMSSAFAQQSGLVNVELSNVANNIAKNISVEVSQIPVSVQVPVTVAAAVCGVDANVLSRQLDAPSNCAAKSTSSALDQAVQEQIKGTAQK